MYKKQGDVLLRQVDGDCLVYNPYTNETLVVNDLTFIILEELAGRILTLEGIFNEVKDNSVKKFDGLNFMEVEETLKYLVARGVVICTESLNQVRY